MTICLHKEVLKLCSGAPPKCFCLYDASKYTDRNCPPYSQFGACGQVCGPNCGPADPDKNPNCHNIDEVGELDLNSRNQRVENDVAMNGVPNDLAVDNPMGVTPTNITFTDTSDPSDPKTIYAHLYSVSPRSGVTIRVAVEHKDANQNPVAWNFEKRIVLTGGLRPDRTTKVCVIEKDGVKVHAILAQ